MPSELGNLSKLQLLIIGNMHLDGPIPSELGNCGALGKKIATAIIDYLLRECCSRLITPILFSGHLILRRSILTELYFNGTNP